MPAKVAELVSGQNENGLFMTVTGLLRNPPEDVTGCDQ